MNFKKEISFSQINQKKSLNLPYPCDKNTSCYPITINLPKNTYLIEVWGAQGGNEGGKGGYSRGILHIHEEVKMFFYIGQESSVKKVKFLIELKA